MTPQGWLTPHWPEGVPLSVSGFDKPLFSILDDAARAYPDNVYTIFSDATRTFAQVRFPTPTEKRR